MLYAHSFKRDAYVSWVGSVGGVKGTYGKISVVEKSRGRSDAKY